LVARDALADDAVAIVLAGGKGTRLGYLTQDICKPALPFAAAWRNIDFTLSNCVNSGIRRIGIATQYKPEALLAHIRDAWRCTATGRGEFIGAWQAENCAPRGFYRGTADAVYHNLYRILQQDCGLVLVLAGDHVYNMDYRPMLDAHRRAGADVTVGCVEVAPREARQFGVLSIDGRSRIRGFVEKPQCFDELPPGNRVLASMGIYVFETAFLARTLLRDACTRESRHDFGGDVLPRVLRKARMYAFPFEGSTAAERGYWRDVGTPAAYWRAHLDLLEDSPQLHLDDPQWPLRGARIRPQFTLEYADSNRKDDSDRSLVAGGCRIEGKLHRSVLFSDVRVGRSATIESSVILPGAVIGRNCRLSGAIVIGDCRIPDGMVIESNEQPVVVSAEVLEQNLAMSCA
jgi:glucose-1-phosphate adenylyltransferase